MLLYLLFCYQKARKIWKTMEANVKIGKVCLFQWYDIYDYKYTTFKSKKTFLIKKYIKTLRDFFDIIIL